VIDRVTVGGLPGERVRRTWVFAVTPGRHTISFADARGRAGQAVVDVSGDTRWCWDFDLDRECAP
jgi:hypothetical protein